MLQPVSSWEDQEPKHTSVLLADGSQNIYYVLTDLSRNYFVTGIRDTVVVYSLPDFRSLHSLTRPGTHLSSLDAYLRQPSVSIYDLVSGQCLHTLPHQHKPSLSQFLILEPELVEIYENGVTSIEKLPKEALLVTWSHLGSAFKIWRLPLSGEIASESSNDDTSQHSLLLRSIKVPGHKTTSLESRGRTIMTGGDDCALRVWDVFTGNFNWVLIGHRTKIVLVGFDQLKSQSYSLDNNGIVRVWNLRTGKCQYVLEPQTNYIQQMAIFLSYLIHSQFDGSLYVRDVASGELNYKLDGNMSNEANFRLDDRKLLAPFDDALKILDIHSGRLLKELLPLPKVP
ncbi:WD40-repeat-containing domain protein [Gymnopilus junonius]|uniref:WD40-repeat-containing domain protein n=2 Tax=Gymnopilus junonius TaxID=109634 RepID=A0A9P5TIL2_GYMJU|nr:WD40-repeat-containing domain protein [Gymnopilus junonius]